MNVVALRPQPRFDRCSVVAMGFIPKGRFEALGSPQRWRFGRLGIDALPGWATRVHLNPEDFHELARIVKPDDPQSGDGQASPAVVPDAPAETVVPAGAFLAEAP